MKQRHLLHSSLALLSFAFLSLVAYPAQASLSSKSQLDLGGIGDIRLGMTLKEASDASGLKMKIHARLNWCTAVFPITQDNLQISFLLIDRNDGPARIARIDVDDARITNLAGIGIGSSMADLMKTYPGRIVDRTGRKRYLMFVPKDRSNQKYRYSFTLDNGRIKSFGAGLKEAVDAPEVCA